MALSGWWKSLVGVRYVAPGDGAGDGRVEPVFGSGPPPLPDSVATPAFAEPRFAGGTPLSGPPPLPADPATPDADVKSRNAGAMHRFGARWLDQTLAAMVVYVVFTFVTIAMPDLPSPTSAGIPEALTTVLKSSALALAALMLDGIIRALFGNTLGKKLLKLEVVDRHGVRLSTRAYFNRNANIWCTGFGCGAWIFALILPLVQLWRISRGKPATYDVNTLTRVRVLAPLKTRGKVLIALPFILATGAPLVSLGYALWNGDSHDVGPITHSWANPITQHTVGMPDIWINNTRLIPATSEGLKPVVAFDDAQGTMGVLLYRFTVHKSTTQDRARAYREVNAARLDFDDGGTFDTIGPAWERWTVHAVGREDNIPRIVTIYRHDDDYWLLTAFDRVGASKESPKLKDLRDRVAQTVLGRPQP